MKTITLIPAALLAHATCAFAQHPPVPPPDIGSLLDKNRDRELSSREIRYAHKSLLKLDVNGDGMLGESELRPPPPDDHPGKMDDDEAHNGPPPPPPPSGLMIAIDTNGDGSLSKAELENADAALLKLDADTDGNISEEEAPCLGHPHGALPGPPDGGRARPPGPPPGTGPRGGN